MTRPNSPQGSLQGKHRGKGVRGRERFEDDFENGRRSHKPKGIHLNKARKQILPQSRQKEHRPVNTLTFSPVRVILDLTSKTIKEYNCVV